MGMIFVPQRGLHDCATACCSMVLRYYGRLHQYRIIDTLLRPKRERQTSMQSMIQCLCNYSLLAEGRKQGIPFNFTNKEIGIYHMRSGKSHHFVVVKAVRNGILMPIYDPRFLWITFRSRRYFRTHWTGYYLVIKGQKFTNKVPIELGIPFFIKAFFAAFLWIIAILILFKALMQV